MLETIYVFPLCVRHRDIWRKIDEGIIGRGGFYNQSKKNISELTNETQSLYILSIIGDLHQLIVR